MSDKMLFMFFAVFNDQQILPFVLFVPLERHDSLVDNDSRHWMHGLLRARTTTMLTLIQTMVF